MSIGRIEMIDGKKQYVRYATLGGGKTEPVGVPLGNVQDLALEESTVHLTLTWKDPDDVVFNGEKIAEWAGTKVIRKEGSSPENVDDGILIADSTVRDQYSVGGLQDTDVAAGTQYNYTLFPYTTKNVYTMSDANRVSGKVLEYYPTLADNTWDTIAEISANGKASEVWNIGDEKDGYRIIGFNHDDLCDGSGSAGITFFTINPNKFGVYHSEKTRVLYKNSTIFNRLNDYYNDLPEQLKRNIKKVKKEVCASTSYSKETEMVDVFLFLLSFNEVTGSDDGGIKTGMQYVNAVTNDLEVDGTEKFYWFRDLTYRDTLVDVASGWINRSHSIDFHFVNNTAWDRFAFCI